MQLRNLLALIAVLGACTGPGPRQGIGPRTTTSITETASESHGGASEKATGPRQAYEWRRLRWLDENGRLDTDGRRRARAQRDANIAHWRNSRVGSGAFPQGWREVGPDNIAGRTRSLVIHPTITNRMWAGAVGGGIWRSDSGGSSWYPVGENMGNQAIGCLAMDPTNPQTMYAGTGEIGLSNGRGGTPFIAGEGIWKTIDGGTSWFRLSSTVSWGDTTRIAVSPGNPNHVIAATSAGIQFSGNGGFMWTLVRPASGGSLQVLFDPNDPNKCVGHVRDGSANRVVRSISGGTTWTNAITPQLAAAPQRIELAYGPANPDLVFALIGGVGLCEPPNCTAANYAQVWWSFDGGANWSQRTSAAATSNVGQWWYDAAIWVDPTTSSRVVIGGQQVWRSEDAGATFTLINNYRVNTDEPHPDVHFFAHDPGYNGQSNRRLYVCSDGGVHVASDIATASPAAGWTRRDREYRTIQYYGAAGDGPTGIICGGTQDNGHLTIQTQSGFPENALFTFGGDGGFAAIDPTDPNYQYGEYVHLQIHRATNPNLGASYIYGGITDANDPARSNFIAPFVLDPNQPNRLLAGGRSLWRSNNAKAPSVTWAPIKPDVGVNISAIAVAPSNSNVIWVGHNDGRIYRTGNGTAANPTWTAVDNNGGVNPLPNRYICRILIDRGSSSRAYVGLGGFNGDNLWRTVNSGSSFADVTGSGSTGLPDAPIYGITQHPAISDYLYVATEVGVYGSTDSGATWATTTDGPDDISVQEVNFLSNSSTLLAATHGRGLWSAPVFEPEVASFGVGCIGSAGLPSLTATGARIGDSVAINATNLVPEQPAWLAQGWSRTTWFGNTLPFDLQMFGAAGCSLRVAGDIVRDARSDGAGNLTTSLPIANNPALVGTTFYLQLLPGDPAANSFGRTATNAIRLTIGY